jgi:hypothetical protein
MTDLNTVYRFRCHVLPGWRLSPQQTIAPTVLPIISSHGPHRKHCSSVSVSKRCLEDGAENTIPLLLFAGRCQATRLRATIFITKCGFREGRYRVPEAEGLDMVKPPPPKHSIDVPDNNFAECGVEFKNRRKGRRL